MSVTNSQFQRVGINNPSRSVFDLTSSYMTDCDFGQLIPVYMKPTMPGDVFEISNEVVVRMMPLVSPCLHEIDVTVHYFEVANRNIWDSWEDFITSGEDGTDSTALPRWDALTADTAIGSLWDKFGFPTGVNWTDSDYSPIDFPLRYYNNIWNEWYRDQLLQTEQSLTDTDLLYRNWSKDYFTSSLTSLQKGTQVALPITGTTSAVWTNSTLLNGNTTSKKNLMASDNASQPYIYSDGANNAQNMLDAFNANTVDLSSATAFGIDDFREVVAIQQWMERNNRCGNRYQEFIKSGWNVDAGDHRLDRPAYIGGSKSPVVISEVIQTSESNTTEQGNLAGHGLAANGQTIARHRCKEYGAIIGILSIMPKTAYGQGIPKEWTYQTRYDFPHQEFVNLSEEPILRGEIYYTGAQSNDSVVFGYQAKYDEYRTSRDVYTGNMRGNLDHWHLGRKFASAPALNEAFIKCDGTTTDMRRIFASDTTPGFIVHVKNNVKAIRPLPVTAEPGLLKI